MKFLFARYWLRYLLSASLVAVTVPSTCAQAGPGTQISLSQQISPPGGQAELTLTLQSPDVEISGLQFDFEYYPASMDVQIQPSPVLGTDKQVNTADLKSGSGRVLIIGMNQLGIPNGAIVRFMITLRPDAAEAYYPIRLLNAVAVDPSGTAVPVSTSNGAVTVARSQALRVDNVVNSASQAAGAIAAGEIVSIMGAGFTSDIGVSVNGRPAEISYVGATQINATVPVTTGAAGSARLQVSASGGGNVGLDVPLSPVAPGIFTLDATGSGQGAILNQDLTVNSPANPAPAGTGIAVFVTGIGNVSAETTAVTGQVGEKTAQVLYAGAAPGLSFGVQQVNLRIPPELSAGERVNIAIIVGSARSQPGVTVAIR